MLTDSSKYHFHKNDINKINFSCIKIVIPRSSMKKHLENFKKINKSVLLVSVFLAIYGCSSIEDEVDLTKEPPMTPEQQQQFILEKAESWSLAEPDIERVLALESDMQLIIDQLASMAELDDNPLGNNPTQTTVSNGLNSTKSGNYVGGGNPSTQSTVNNGLNGIKANNAIEEGEKTNSTNNAQSAHSSSWESKGVQSLPNSSGHSFPKIGIHIGMFKDVNTIPLGWKYLQSILPEDLIDKKPLLAVINYEDTEYYSLRIGPLTSANLAKKMCIHLQQQKQHYCSVVEYKGLSFN